MMMIRKKFLTSLSYVHCSPLIMPQGKEPEVSYTVSEGFLQVFSSDIFHLELVFTNTRGLSLGHH